MPNLLNQNNPSDQEIEILDIDFDELDDLDLPAFLSEQA